MSTSRAQPGLTLADSGFQAEATAYLQQRLRIFYRVIFGVAAALYVVVGVMMTIVDGWSMRCLAAPSRIAHLGAVIALAVLALGLRFETKTARKLLVLDVGGLWLCLGTTLAVCTLEYRSGVSTMATVLALFVVGRAVAVPSSPKTTFLVSMPAPIGMLVLQLAFGTIYPEPGVMLGRAAFIRTVIMQQTVAWLFVGVATVASHVNYTLRLEMRRVRRLGQYRLEERIGAGAMGEVYRARHAMLRRPTAIKLLHPEITGEDTLQRFEREVREASRLSHPNTISIYDYGRTPEGVFYYAMELLDGADLEALVKRHGPFPPSRVIHVLTQACAALREAHDAGLVHRDIKPGNLMLCRSGGEPDRLKVVDFGLVKDLRHQSPTLSEVGAVCGTPETLAPEVLGGFEAGPAADQYALGVVGYFLLTGVAVWDTRSGAEFIGHHLHSAPVPLEDRDPNVPRDLAAILMRCLEKDPAARWSSVAEMRAALRRCAAAGQWTEEDADAWWRAVAA